MSSFSPVEIVLAYHERTKHLPGRFARSLGYMDWDTQPDPFRRYAGAPLVSLARVPFDASDSGPRYEPAFLDGGIARRPLDRESISQLFYDSLALSAWKQAGGTRWSLRVNPSSGNLHPTEGYLVAGPIFALSTEAAVFHYAPRGHGLEQRAVLPSSAWAAIASQLPADAVLVGLSSIHWREAWKYGERAFRYCQHDMGHAIAGIAIAAAGLGWEARLVENVDDDTIAALLGIGRQSGPEREWPEALIAVYPHAAKGRDDGNFPIDKQRAFSISSDFVAAVRAASWMGEPNRLSSEHHLWPEIDAVAEATRKPLQAAPALLTESVIANPVLTIGDAPLGLRPIVHQRRSAVALDGKTGITRDAFVQMIAKAQPGIAQVPFTTMVLPPRIDLLLFIHRVADVAPGLYALVRDPVRVEPLRAALDPGFAWRVPEGIPSSLRLYLLEAGDARKAAVQTSCGQEFAGQGVLTAAMIADYRAPIEDAGAWMYRRLFWEAGALGQLLYLEAEAMGTRGSGIGCYFDDLTHRIFGLRDSGYQVLYHFTMGGAVEDERLETLPPYAHLG